MGQKIIGAIGVLFSIVPAGLSIGVVWVAKQFGLLNFVPVWMFMLCGLGFCICIFRASWKRLR